MIDMIKGEMVKMRKLNSHALLFPFPFPFFTCFSSC